MIGKIKRVPLRDVWRHEARDFTVWLEENVDVLNDLLDINLSSAEREQSAGSFKLDIRGEDDQGNIVVIENQLERSDHDHLGKLLTYLTSFEAKIAIWIVSDARPEHIKAIAWLNESSTASFYLVKVDAIQIGDSEPAPLMTLITGPSIEAQTVGQIKKDSSERQATRREFWAQLLTKAKKKTSLHATRNPPIGHWIGHTTGLPAGTSLSYTINQKFGRVDFYIDVSLGRSDGEAIDSAERNKIIFENLLTHQVEIEREFNKPLNWAPMENKRACSIWYKIERGGYKNIEDWDLIQDEMIDSMIGLEKALKPFLNW